MKQLTKAEEQIMQILWDLKEGVVKQVVEGFIAVVHSGGNLVKYLRNRSQQYMKLKQIALKRFSDTLAVLAEFYVTLMVAGSLIFVVMLAVMSMFIIATFNLSRIADWFYNFSDNNRHNLTEEMIYA